MKNEVEVKDTLSERGGKYGDFRDNARISQNLKMAMHDSPNWSALPPYMKESLELITLKVARILSGDPLYQDNHHDILGYAKLMEDRAKQDRDNGVVVRGHSDPMYPEYKHVESPSSGDEAQWPDPVEVGPERDFPAMCVNITPHEKWVLQEYKAVPMPLVRRINGLTDAPAAAKMALIVAAMGDE